MVRVRVIVNEVELDAPEFSKLPISLTRSVSKFDKIASGTGMKADNTAKALVLPATKKNLDNLLRIKGLARVIIESNGIQCFAGLGKVVSYSQGRTIKKDIRVQLLGDGLEIWNTLSKISLRDLDLGEVVYDGTTIEASWDNTTTLGYVFPPVIYGQLSGAPIPNPTPPPDLLSPAWQKSFRVSDFRPALFFPYIVEAIANYIGYEVDSRFHFEEIFTRGMYMFGVGDLWQRSDDVSLFATHVQDQNGVDQPINGTEIQVEFPTTVTDPSGQMTTTTTFTAGVSGEYTFNFRVEGFFLFDFYFSAPPTLSFLRPSYDTTIDFGNNHGFWSGTVTIFLQAGQTVTIEVSGSVPGSSRVVDAELIATLKDGVTEGATISLASCLHDKPVTDFLKGIGHMFNLEFRAIPAIRRFQYEPRLQFQYNVNGSTRFGDGWRISIVPVDGAPDNIQAVALHQDSINIERREVFGRELILRYKIDQGDPMYTLYKEIDTDPTTGVYITKTAFEERAKDGVDSFNPFFTDMFLSSSNEVGGYILPTIMPSQLVTDENLQNVWRIRIVFIQGAVMQIRDSALNPAVSWTDDGTRDNQLFPGGVINTALKSADLEFTFDYENDILTILNYPGPETLVDLYQATGAGAPRTLERASNFGGQLPEPTFESEPKCGFINYNATGIYTEGIRKLAGGQDEYLFFPNVPLIVQQNLIFQHPDLVLLGTPVSFTAVNALFSYAYCDHNQYNHTKAVQQQVRGLTSTFYYQYLAIIRNDEWLTAQANIGFAEFSTENFRSLKYATVEKIPQLWILITIQAFKPNVIDLSTVKMIRWVWHRQQDVDLTQHNDLETFPVELVYISNES